MGLALVTGPSTDPVTLAEAKAHCREDSADADGLIAGYILAARAHIEGQIHRPIVSRMYNYTIDRTWPKKCSRIWIELPLPPLQAVRSVSYVDENGATQTLSTNLYSVSTDKPKGLIVPAYDAVWPSVRDQVAAITVRFIAGYTAFTDTLSSPNYTVSGPGVPDDLRQALLMLIGHWYEHREAIVLGQTPTEVPLSVEALISPYRVVSF